MTVLSTYLHPAEMCFSADPCRVDTVLGSCVAVTMWDRRRLCGCICHAVLPSSRGKPDDPLRYVDSAIAGMLHALESHASRRPDLEVKLFGGASMNCTRSGHKSVGEQNVEAALAVLADAGLAPSVADVGGRLGRKVRFYTATGEILLKRIRTEAAG